MTARKYWPLVIPPFKDAGEDLSSVSTEDDMSWWSARPVGTFGPRQLFGMSPSRTSPAWLIAGVRLMIFTQYRFPSNLLWPTVAQVFLFQAILPSQDVEVFRHNNKLGFWTLMLIFTPIFWGDFFKCNKLPNCFHAKFSFLKRKKLFFSRPLDVNFLFALVFEGCGNIWHFILFLVASCDQPVVY